MSQPRSSPNFCCVTASFHRALSTGGNGCRPSVAITRKPDRVLSCLDRGPLLAHLPGSPDFQLSMSVVSYFPLTITNIVGLHHESMTIVGLCAFDAARSTLGLYAGPYPEVVGGGGGGGWLQLVPSCHALLVGGGGAFNLQNRPLIYFSLAPGGGGGVLLTPNPPWIRP